MTSRSAHTSRLLQQKAAILEYLARQSNPLSTVSFVNIFIWQDHYDFTTDIIDDNCCVFAADAVGAYLYLPPLGARISSKAIRESFQTMQERNAGRPVSRVENVCAEQLRYFDDPNYHIYEKPADYVYRREDLARLKGNRYKTHRWAYNHFTKNYRAVFRPYEPHMKQACLALFQRWAAERHSRSDDPIYGQMLKDNEPVHRRILQGHQEIGLVGRVVEIDGRLAGYTFGFALNSETFCILCEIIDLSYKGAAVYCFHEFCRDEALQSYRFINTMDDSGLPNLHRQKESFHPVQRIRNYVVALSNK